jgi:DNA (cytosine-5)-methyltransferase 1
MKNNNIANEKLAITKMCYSNKYSLQIYGPHSLNCDGSIMPFNEQMAIVSHYLHNKCSKFDSTYKNLAEGLIEDIYAVRETQQHSPILSDVNVQYSLFDDFFNVPFLPISNPKFTFIDLFAGIGGFRMAMQNLGVKCVFSSEWDSQAQKTYLRNYGEVPFGDITKESVKSYIPNDFDILCAGFPCQAFSLAGKKLGFEETRGTLFFDVARIVKEKRPKVVFMENVKNFASHDDGKTLAVVKATMEELGYSFHARVLNAVDYGMPQKRERIYMVCFRNDINDFGFQFPAPFPLKRHVEDFLLDDESMVEKLYIKRDDMQMNGEPDDKYSNKSIRLGIVNKGGQGERIYSTKGIAITLSAYGGGVFAKTGGYLVNGRTRRLHPRECARIMGYPDSYVMAKNANQAYKQFGNSVVVDVLQYIATEFGRTLKNNRDI